MNECLQNSLLNFYTSKDLDILKIRETVFRLSEEVFNSIHFVTFIEFSKGFFLTISIEDRKYSRISRKLISSLGIGDMAYDKQGSFTFSIKSTDLVNVLEDISSKTMKLLEALSSKDFLLELDENRSKIKSFPKSNFFHLIDKESYLKIYQVEDCIWLSNISLLIYQSSDSINVRCFLENKHSKKLKLIKEQQLFQTYFNNIEDLIFKLDFQFHSTLMITNEIFSFFIPQTSFKANLEVSYLHQEIDRKVFSVKPVTATIPNEIKISIEASETPEEFLKFLNNRIFFFNSTVRREDD